MDTTFNRAGMLNQSPLNTFRNRLRSIEDRIELRHQIALATSVLCFAIVVTLAVGAAMVGRSEAIRAASDRLSDIAITLTERLDHNVGVRVAAMEHMASLAPLRDTWLGPPDVLRHTIEDTRRAFSGTAWIGFVGTDGVVVAASDRILEGQSVADQLWFQQGLKQSSVVDSTIGSSAVAFPDEQQRGNFIDIGIPVFGSAGEVLGVLGVFISRTWVERLRVSTIADVNADQAIEVSLFSQAGTGAIHPANGRTELLPEAVADMFAAGNGVRPDTDDMGYLTAYAVAGRDPKRPRWLVVARQDSDIALRAANRVVSTIIALGSFVGAAGIIAAMLIAARLARPFGELADKAALIGRNSETMLPRVRGSFEATRLSSALRALVMRLTHAERASAEVEDRAAEAKRQLNRDIARLRSLVDLDPLTELLNRRAFVEIAGEAMRQYQRHGRPFAILMIDVDHFKAINDSLGHASGDDVIRAVAQTIASVLRPNDRGARFGGEEFIVLLQDVTVAEATEIAERMRAHIAALPIAGGASGELFVTVSIGIAACDACDADIDAVTERADGALYAAKRDGRNRSVVAPASAVATRRSA